MSAHVADDEWAEADLQNPGWPPHGDQDPASSQQPLSARFFQPRQPRSGSSPPVRVQASARERPLSPEAGAKDRFRGAKQLFMSLERRKDKERKTSASPLRAAAKPAAPAQLPIEGAGAGGGGGSARWSRQSGGGWPGSDRDTGYASRYSRDKSRNRDFDPEPEKLEARPGPGNIFVKSGKKSADSKLQSKRLSRFLSRETIESDGYDQIEEFEDERQRARVKRQPSRTSLKLDPRRSSSRDPALRDTAATPEPAAGPRRGFIRREVTELDLKGYMAGRAQPGLDPAAGFSKKYTAPALWAVPGPGGPRERAMSPARLRAGARELEAEAGRYPKVLMPEFRGGRVPGCVGPDTRYPSLDLRTDKRKSMYEGAGEVAAARGRQFPAPATDYRRRSYHELSDVDRLDHAHCHAPRNFQHSGRKQCPDPIGLPSRAPRGHPAPAPAPAPGYRLLPSAERFPGLDRDTARPHPQPHPPHWPGPRSYEGAGPGGGRAMFRHSYAEPVSGPPLHFPHHAHGRFGLSSLKPY